MQNVKRYVEITTKVKQTGQPTTYDNENFSFCVFRKYLWYMINQLKYLVSFHLQHGFKMRTRRNGDRSPFAGGNTNRGVPIQRWENQQESP